MSNESDFASQREKLIAEIMAAFNSISREDGITLHEALAVDNWKSDAECQAARHLDTEHRWQDVPDKDILACCSALSFLDNKGFHYYLPAFMVYGLKHFENDPTGIINSCEYHLLHDYPNSLDRSEPAAIAGKYGFTNAQCSAIAKFLRLNADMTGDDDLPTLSSIEKWENYVQELISRKGEI